MWQRKKLTYDICVPKLDKPIALLSSDEARAYFDWFLDKIPERISYLASTVSKDLGIDESQITFSPESLIVIWKWFLSVARTEPTESSDVTSSNKIQFDLQTEYIIRDIGMFLGELFNSQYKSINWSYYETPETDFFVKRPLLIGFKDNCVSPPFDAVFEPIHMTGVQASNILFGRQKEDDLLKIFNIWTSKIIEEQ